ncbi:MAG: DedA family protein [Cyanobacteria bacterium]|nr:DedA family protein [Cyanobacteria bacterium CG_2015-16_32_12]NCO78818.1 DedA family protein [Cyanobacteria bacterium CG_2015-22_32_23]NCQ05199.1 DedA family protein [Cyanobacteria bacterium CG_2015-09_32_10]NCQ41370.1 DedA family protein [Cyanobacteria bacterium CG_2015-04_32_10]NCS85103.1 DedA family protein [Cyanobacteria bacterium CG_2015-02_32_10]
MTEWITNTMNSLGYVGIALLMFAENLFPPIPSELIMPLAGFTVSQGKMQLIPAIFAGVIGTILGAFPWYYLGKIVDESRLEKLADKYGKWIFVSGSDINKANKWFNQYGNIAVFLGRLVPGVRTLISLPAGINNMNLSSFVIYSTIGTIIWVSLLTVAGYVLGDNFSLVEKYIAPLSKIALLSIVFLFVIWVIRKQKRK